MRFLAAGDTCLTVEFGTAVDFALSAKVLALNAILDAQRPAGVVELMPTLRSLSVYYDPVKTSHAALVAAIRPLLKNAAVAPAAGRSWTLPACYDASMGLDLKEVAQACGLTEAALVAAHTGVTHRVLMIGFMPGHPYMGELPPAIQLPRRATPRTHVPAGSVAIATNMTVVYTAESPGGWHILGRSPAPLFDVRRPEPVLLAPGDEVIFQPIGTAAFASLFDRAASGEWVPTPQRLAGAAP